MQGLDESIVLSFQSIRCEQLTQFFSIFILLDFWYLTAFVFVFLCFFRTKTLRVPVISVVLARVLSEFCYGVLKQLVHRPRPFMTIKGLVPIMPPHGYSFPSGHATFAMAMAVVLYHHFPKSKSLVLVLAVLVGLSRVYFGVHYLTDVLAGFALGAVLGYLAIFLEKMIVIVTKGLEFHGRTS